MHLMKYCFFFIVIQFSNHVKGQQYDKYKLIGTPEFPAMEETFIWTCEMYKPNGSDIYAVFFKRNRISCGSVGYINDECFVREGANSRYKLGCTASQTSFTLTIPAENMTEYEQGSRWYCEYIDVVDKGFLITSPSVILNIRIDVNNASLSPSDFPLTIREGASKEINCVVNSNAFPIPTITWFIGSKNITDMAGKDTTFITITGNRTDNNNILQCKATNNNKDSKTASTKLNIEYPSALYNLSPKDIIEGRNLSVSCMATTGNPNSTIFFWTKAVDNITVFRQNGSTLQIPTIDRKKSGTYKCTLENFYSNGEKETQDQSMIVNVLYAPVVDSLSQQDIIEGEDLSVTCMSIHGNPRNTTYYWTKEGDQTFGKKFGALLKLFKIQRNSSGKYRCTAENNFSNGEKGTDSQTMKVNVLYPPVVYSFRQQDIIEGTDLSVTCNYSSGNPSPTTFLWTKENNQSFKQYGTVLQLPTIQKSEFGTYICTAENNLTDTKKGKHSQSMVVNVLYHPTIESKQPTIVNESEIIEFTRRIFGNPLSNVSWYNETELLKFEVAVTTATFTIEKTSCTDTKNYTIVATNGIGSYTSDFVELFVNCKPRSYKTNVTLGVTDTTGIDFSISVIAYPEPLIKLEYENGTESDQMVKSINRNAVNNFTIQISQAVVNQSDFGIYHLKVWNSHGILNVIVNVIPQRKPNVPVSIEIACEERSAKVQWKSSFNGGDPQLFTVIASSGQQINNISDKGENVIHSTFVQHLQPSTMYVFYVSAQNSHGFISSEKISCTTLAESSDTLPIIVGSAAAGGLTLVVVLVVVVFLFRRYTNTEKQAGKSQRFENDLDGNESVDDDGLKDNILYVSADPRENEKHEAAVYAAVNKKDPMGNNNSNVYAEVKKIGIKDVKEGAIYSDVKPKKGFFKKGGKVKKEKRQKKEQEVADVYENSDDIAMTANPDNVYSNTNPNNDSAKEQRGYKNKDGLLYVEVKFDTKTEERNPVIHGDDEKTDYATVEFPVPSSSHDRE